MKKLIFQLILFFLPCGMIAQSEWEVPDVQKPVEAKTAKKIKEKKPSAPEKEVKLKIDPKYAAGTVPVVDGKVEWTENITCNKKGANEVFEKMFSALTALTKSKGQTDKSRIVAMNRKEHIIAGYFEEEMIFSSGTFAKDFTIFRYTIIADCKDGVANVRLCRMSYEYEKGRETEAVYTAESWITDEEALNKKKTNLYRINGKFRKKTIDRKEEIFSFIKNELSK